MDSKFEKIVFNVMKAILGFSILCLVLVFTFSDEMPKWVRIVALLPVGLMLIGLIVAGIVSIAENRAKQRAKRLQLEAKRYCQEHGHDWDMCVCRNCGELRDEMHDWDGCICRRCGTKRDTGHNWGGCICRRCGKRRDEGHQWITAFCERCGGTGYLSRNLSYGDPGYGDSDDPGEPCNCVTSGRIRCMICGAERLNSEGESLPQ